MKVNKWITLRKAATRGIQYAAVAVAALQTVTVPADVGVGKQATIVFIIGALGAISKGIHNYRKTAATPVRYSGYGLLLLMALSLGGMLAGCVTTTAPDGTVTQSVDPAALSTAWAAWERLEDRKAALEAERDAADARDRAAIEAELRRLEPELRDAAERLGVAGP